MKPFCEASERNRGPILEKLRLIFDVPGEVLEIGSGTGQHAMYFARHLGHLVWQCSDLGERHDGINAWLDEAGLENVLPPVSLDVVTGPWPERRYPFAFAANVAHIMAWTGVETMFAGVSNCLESAGRFVLYGPFNYGGEYTSEGNRRFDAMLREENPVMGLRDIEDIRALADRVGLRPGEDHPMPANNRLLVFLKD